MKTKTLIIHRKRGFASALMPFWIVTDMSKAEFKERFLLTGDVSDATDALGQPVSRMAFDPDEYGVRIANGETLELAADEKAATVFAMTMEGLLSNELSLDTEAERLEIEVRVKGGWNCPSFPVLAFCEEN